MLEKETRIEEYRRTGMYYIPAGTLDLIWNERAGEWRMSYSAQGMRSCMELDKVDREIDGIGCEIILAEFYLDPDKYKLEQVKHMSPYELEKLMVFRKGV